MADSRSSNRPATPAQETPIGERHRLGPRPLPLHLSIQMSTWLISSAALNHLKNGSIPWRPELAKNAAALVRQLESVDPEAFAQAVNSETQCRLKAFADGVLAYRRSPRMTRPAEPPAVWQEGSSRLLDYGAGASDTGNGKGRSGQPLLVVPSLINRAYILDLHEKRSFLRALAEAGFRPFLLDWGSPDESERKLDLGALIAGRLENALDAAVEHAGATVDVIGYCMGGLLALALAQRRPDRTASLALLATPWDFHAGGAANTTMLSALRPQIEAVIDATGALPVDALQTLFASLAPYATTEKFRRFAALKPDSARAREFIALEDWLNDGVPLAGPVAKECLFDWYVENRPARKRWSVADTRIDPTRVAVPALAVIPQRDYIVPPASAQALATALPAAEAVSVAAGHIGMVAGRRFRSLLLTPLIRWLKRQAR